MPSPRHIALAVALLASALSTPAAGQQAAAPPAAPAGIGGDLLTDLADVEQKVLGLARAIPADQYDWRPAAGVRSVGEVLRHVAADNYLLPALLGHAPDPATGIRADDFATAQAFERRALDRDATIAALERSFGHLRASLRGTAAGRFAEPVTLFGRPSTVQRTWLLTATHLHEHLGQLIAYARSVGTAPPWSRGG